MMSEKTTGIATGMPGLWIDEKCKGVKNEKRNDKADEKTPETCKVMSSIIIR